MTERTLVTSVSFISCPRALTVRFELRERNHPPSGLEEAMSDNDSSQVRGQP